MTCRIGQVAGKRVTVSAAQPDDLPRLLPLVEAYYAFEGIPFEPARATCALRDLVDNPQYGRIWLIRKGEEPIGYAVLCYSYSVENGGRDALVDELFLREPYRGQGIGRQILCQTFKEMKALGVKSVCLEVARDNRRAQNFYRSLGFDARGKYMLMEFELGEAKLAPGPTLA